MRRVSGYNLDEFVKPQPFGLHRLAVGSEGTLVAVVEMKMRLVRRPKFTALDVIHYDDLQAALESSVDLLTTGPYAVEVTDKMILDLARENIEQRARMGFVQGDPAAIMMVEYSGESEAEVRAKVEALEALRARKRIGYAAHIAYDPAEQQSIWKLRKAGLGLLLGTKGDRKPIAFVEDTAVDPAKLGPFIERFRGVLDRHGARAGYYGHCSVGCLHIRPLINLKDAGEIRKMQAIAEEITALVIEFGGGLSGEHGDGRARSPFNETLYGPRLYDAFRQVKRAFDPKGILNPGNIVDAPPMTEHLRYGPDYRAWEPDTLLDFSGQGGFAGAVEMCNGIGVCRKKLEGTMCPSYMATLDEEHSTRGRANALRAVLSGQGAAVGVHGPPAVRGARPVPRVQGVQGRVPRQRRHGEDQVRVPRPLLPGQRAPPPQPAVRADPRAGPGRIGAGARLELDRALGAAPLAPRARGRHRPAAPAAGVRGAVLRAMVPSPAGPRGRERAARSCCSTTRSIPTRRRRSPSRRRGSWKPSAIAWCSPTADAAGGR